MTRGPNPISIFDYFFYDFCIRIFLTIIIFPDYGRKELFNFTFWFTFFFGDYGFGEQVFCFKKNVFVNAINAQTFWRKKITLFVSSGCKSAF